MEAIVKAKKIGGSIVVLIPKRVVDKERISAEDTLKIKFEKTDNLNFLWGNFEDIKKPTDQIMKEIDEGETDG
jgi:antitoxin component of MazEF toxin-antitoxin module